MNNAQVSPMETIEQNLGGTADERLTDFKAWAISRIRACREQETKFGAGPHPKGPPQALVEAWTERRTLQTALEILVPGFTDRIDALTTELTKGEGR